MPALLHVTAQIFLRRKPVLQESNARAARPYPHVEKFNDQFTEINRKTIDSIWDE